MKVGLSSAVENDIYVYTRDRHVRKKKKKKKGAFDFMSRKHSSDRLIIFEATAAMN